MFPALLAQNPALAEPLVTYRDDTLAAAEANAASLGYQGAFYPWTSGSNGVYSTNCYGGSCSEEIHLQSDIALAQWQYYEATGNKQWLLYDGWPVIQAIAEFWAGRVTAGSDGSYSIDDIQPPDEYVSGVDNDPYTNVGAAETLQIATEAAAIVGQSAPASWDAIATGLIDSLPYDSTDGIYDEYDGYAGATVKQADVTMLTYPLGFGMPDSTALADLNYYSERTDLGGPAMTQAINSIDASLLDQAGCSSYTYLMQSYLPYLQGPFD
jgi:trehalose/maltose hydrolase-like predicted phosphorylase